MFLKTTDGTDTVRLSVREGISNDAWHHAVLTYDSARGDAAELYFDGSLLASLDEFGGALVDDSDPANNHWLESLTLGAYWNVFVDPVDPFDGQLDQFALWMRSLDAAEVAELYASGQGNAAASALSDARIHATMDELDVDRTFAAGLFVPNVAGSGNSGQFDGIVSQSNAILDAWIDFNGDGVWGGPGEQIADNLKIFNGDTQIIFDIPVSGIPGRAIARFRLSGAGNLGVDLLTSSGEVEDYAVTILPPASGAGTFGVAQTVTNSFGIPLPADVDGDIDVISATATDGTIRLHRNDGSGDLSDTFVVATDADSGDRLRHHGRFHPQRQRHSYGRPPTTDDECRFPGRLFMDDRADSVHLRLLV